MFEEQCQNCRFWRLLPFGRLEKTTEWEPVQLWGECRRFPPTKTNKRDSIDFVRMRDGAPTDEFEAMEVERSAFPVTHGEEWCGEFKAASLVPEYMSWPIEKLELNIRVYHCLMAEKIKTIGEMYAKGNLLELPNIGRTSLAQINHALLQLGLPLLRTDGPTSPPPLP